MDMETVRKRLVDRAYIDPTAYDLESDLEWAVEELERLHVDLAKSQRWAGFLYSCAISGEFPMNRDEFESLMDKK